MSRVSAKLAINAGRGDSSAATCSIDGRVLVRGDLFQSIPHGFGFTLADGPHDPKLPLLVGMGACASTYCEPC
jgi:hypothetical protein